jgi:F0F1-type ATP synthase assembly protein I
VITHLVTWSTIAFFGVIGYLIDKISGLEPIFLIIMLVMSFPVNAWRIKNNLKIQ